METKIQKEDIASEIAMWRSASLPHSRAMIDRLHILQKRMFTGSWIKKIVWDKDGGYPEHSWGYIQYSLRPYRQGYGCDGTTDSNIHLIASTIVRREGWNYEDLFREAYGDDRDHKWLTVFLKEIHQHGSSIRSETMVPARNTPKSCALALNDLYQINLRSLEAVLENLVLAKYPKADQYLSL